ncbi:Gfo/Idh/MocA family protein [Arthrobacter pigmenti]
MNISTKHPAVESAADENQPGSAKIRTAIIGFGTSGRVFHAPLIAAADKYSLDAVVTADPDRRAQAVKQYPGTRVRATVSDLLEEPDSFDLVIVASPPSTHFGITSQLIARGINVVVDKPFVPTSEEGEALIAQAAQVGVKLSVFQNRRWDGDFLTLKQLLDENSLGEVRRFESRFEWWKPHESKTWKAEAGIGQGGGILFDLGTHLIDQAIQLFGPVTDVYSELSSSRPDRGAEDDAFVSLLHQCGLRTHLWMNGVAPKLGPRFHVLGTERGYTKWGLDPQEKALKSGHTPRDDDYGQDPHPAWGRLGFENDLEPVPTHRGNYPEFYRLLALSLHHDAPLPVEPADSVAVLRVIEAIHGHRALTSQNNLKES